jgi:hypothetical protein
VQAFSKRQTCLANVAVVPSSESSGRCDSRLQGAPSINVLVCVVQHCCLSTLFEHFVYAWAGCGWLLSQQWGCMAARCSATCRDLAQVHCLVHVTAYIVVNVIRVCRRSCSRHILREQGLQAAAVAGVPVQVQLRLQVLHWQRHAQPCGALPLRST